jgi:S-DNA-T family DNA segregation ATPase FtsK/SpoIIIE
MSAVRSPRRDLAALALLALTLLLAVSLATYDRSDPPDSLVYPPAEAVHNLCGRAGAVAAVVLLSGLGAGAYYAVASLGVLSAWLLARRPVTQPVIRAGGWLLSVLGLTVLLAAIPVAWWWGPVIGPGGYLGAALTGLLESHVATAGAALLAGSVLLAGLLLSTDLVLPRLAWRVARTPARALRSARVALHTAKAAPIAKPAKAPKSAPAEEDEDDGSSAPALVRVRGKPDLAAPDEEAAEDDATEQVATADDERPSMAARLASALRIKPLHRKTERDLVREQIAAGGDRQEPGDYELPGWDLLLPAETYAHDDHEKEVRRKAKILEKTFASFGFNVRVVEIETGPVIAQYEVELEAGLRLSRITGLADDLAIALRVPSVRIVAPIPGKNTVGIEVPNAERQLVRLREVMEQADAKAGKMRIPFFLGKDVAGNPMIADLSTLPHLLIAGRTGTGKSVCLNTLIMSILMTRRPDEVKMLLIDPKMVELTPYMRLPHLMHPVVTDMRKAEAILGWAVEKMEERYALLARAGVRHVSVYNQLGEDELMDRIRPENDEERATIPTQLPFIVIVADEMADLMMTCPKEVETHIIRLAQKSRAVGIHLVLATQKPTVDVITGLIKSNLPARISFQVSSRTDSRVVLDEMGADKLLGNGDMLFLWPGTSTLLRGQGAFVSDDEINRVVDGVSAHEPQFVEELVRLQPKSEAGAAEPGRAGSRDDLYDQAVEIVLREGRGSVSLLQRSMGIGYGRAARLIDFMAEDGLVGQYAGSQAREVLVSLDQWQAMRAEREEEESPAPSRRQRSDAAVDEPAGARKSPAPRGRAAVEEDDDGDQCPFDVDDEDADDAEADEGDDELDDDVHELDERDARPGPARTRSA